ncbi:hypothetical protein BofuT4_uP049250.1 [Botrytis cinerea T4]|uniref:Uncharacterized protein n=1 Tax=Botryotinia fuckeliana (strain T4) TaxID=999810 RepID=G2XZM0_BOTF4|nr:hypothetical protein BofuT4_uP049250.1 [Botrytis cinerea T4]
MASVDRINTNLLRRNPSTLRRLAGPFSLNCVRSCPSKLQDPAGLFIPYP